MKKVLIFFISAVFGVALFVWVLWSTGWEDITLVLAQVTVFQVAIYLGLSLINFCLYNLRWWIILRSHGHNVRFIPLFLYRMTAYAISYLTPTAQTGGEPVRAYLLGSREKVDMREAASSVIIDKVFEIASLVFFIGCGVVYVVIKGFFSPRMEIVLVALMLFFLLLLFLFFKKTLDGSGFFRSLFRTLRLHKIKRLAHFEEKISHTEQFVAHFFNHSKRSTVHACILISVVTVSFIALEHWFLAIFLGTAMSFSQVFLVSTLPSIAYILPVPGGFGLLEGGHTSLFAYLGLNGAVAFALVMLIRLRDLVFVAIGILYGLMHGFRMIRKKSAAINLAKVID